MKTILLVLAFLSGLATQALADQPGECLLRVEGKVYMQGPCTYSFEYGVYVMMNRTWTVYVYTNEDGTAEGNWNAQQEVDKNGRARYVPISRAHAPLPDLKQQGSCFKSRSTEICVWSR